MTRGLPEIIQVSPNIQGDSHKRIAETQKSKGDYMTEVRFEDGKKGAMSRDGTDVIQKSEKWRKQTPSTASRGSMHP